MRKYILIALMLVSSLTVASMVRAETRTLDLNANGPVKLGPPGMMPSPLPSSTLPSRPGLMPRELDVKQHVELNENEQEGVPRPMPENMKVFMMNHPMARPSVSPEARETMKARLAEGFTAMKENIAEHKDELKAKFGEEHADRIVKIREEVGNRFDNALTTLHMIEAKLNEIVAKVADHDIDTTEVSSLLSDASDDITAAEEAVAAMQTTVSEDTTGASTVKDSGKAARDAVTKAHMSIKTVAEALRNLIQSNSEKMKVINHGKNNTDEETSPSDDESNSDGEADENN